MHATKSRSNRGPRRLFAAAALATLALAASAAAQPHGITISVGTQAGQDVRYVQLTLTSAHTWNAPGIFWVYNHDSTQYPAFSPLYVDADTLIVHLPDGLPPGGTHAHFGYASFQVNGNAPSAGDPVLGHAQLYDENYDLIADGGPCGALNLGWGHDGSTDSITGCGPSPAPPLANDSLYLRTSTCPAANTITVEIKMSDLPENITGGQFFLNYDAAVLTFLNANPGDAPFTLQIWQQATIPGYIEYAVGVAHGSSGTGDNTVLARFTFDATEICANEHAAHPLVWFTSSIGGAPTRLTYGPGQELVPDLVDLHAFSVDFTPPAFTFVPSNLTIECDDPIDPANTGGFATASDNCSHGLSPKITYSDAVNMSACGGYTGTITRTWTATDACGNVATDDQVITVQDTQAPQVAWSQSDIWRRADAGLCTSQVSWIEPVAGTDYWDNCTAAGDIVVTSTHSPGHIFDAGTTTTVTYTFTDACGNFDTHSFEVEVANESVVEFTLEIPALANTPLVWRCVEIVYETPGGPITVEQSAPFVNGVLTGWGVIPTCVVDCGRVRDPLHTLWSEVTLSTGPTIHGSADIAFIVEATLVSGDLNGDNLVDILDFGVFVWQWAVSYGTGDTDCNTPFPHADLTGNGLVEIDEFAIISFNFLKTGDATCWSSPGMAPPGGFGRPTLRPQAQLRPLRSVTIEELRRRGLGHLAIADLNGDGVIDEVDIALFFAGVRP